MARVRMLCFALVAILSGVAAANALLALMGPRESPARARVDALEQRVGALQNEVRAQSLMHTAMLPRSGSEIAPSFHVVCPTSWRALGAIGQGLWGCQTSEPLEGGFHPNCSVTSSKVDAGTAPREFYEQVSGPRSALQAVRKYGGREVMLREAAYEASFEHELTGTVLRVLATVFVRGEHAFALTCSVPPDALELFAPQFQAVARSFAFK